MSKTIYDLMDGEITSWIQKQESIYQYTLDKYVKLIEEYKVIKQAYKGNGWDNDSHSNMCMKDYKYEEDVTRLHIAFMESLYDIFAKHYQIFIQKNNDLIKQNREDTIIHTYTDEQMERFKKLGAEIEREYTSTQVRLAPVDKDIILDNIFVQFEGMTIEEFHNSQIKRSLKSCAYNTAKNMPNCSIKGNKVTLDYLYIESSYNISTVYKALCAALKVINDQEDVLKQFVSHDYHDEISSVYSENALCEGNGLIKKVKFYKNHRCDIWFSKKEKAEEFISEWCGLPELVK